MKENLFSKFWIDLKNQKVETYDKLKTLLEESLNSNAFLSDVLELKNTISICFKNNIWNEKSEVSIPFLNLRTTKEDEELFTWGSPNLISRMIRFLFYFYGFYPTSYFLYQKNGKVSPIMFYDSKFFLIYTTTPILPSFTVAKPINSNDDFKNGELIANEHTLQYILLGWPPNSDAYEDIYKIDMMPYINNISVFEKLCKKREENIKLFEKIKRPIDNTSIETYYRNKERIKEELFNKTKTGKRLLFFENSD